MPMRYNAPFPSGSGDPAWPRGPHAMRIGDAERDVAAADLGDHYAAGRLDLDELHERLDAVFTAKTFGQLTRVMSDLPGARRPAPGTGPGRLAPVGPRPEPGLHGVGWGPAGFRYEGYLGTASSPWFVPDSPGDAFRSRDLRESPTPTDRAGRFAALSLLLLAMLIWLFTALLFARHGFSHPASPIIPGGSVSHFYPQGGG
jgi:Domain of unknown function (DUF1707)